MNSLQHTVSPCSHDATVNSNLIAIQLFIGFVPKLSILVASQYYPANSSSSRAIKANFVIPSTKLSSPSIFRKQESVLTYLTKLSSSLLPAPIGGPSSFFPPLNEKAAIANVVPRVAMASCIIIISKMFYFPLPGLPMAQ